MTRMTTGRNKATQRSEERSRAERRRGEQTLMLPRRPQMLRQLQTSPLRSPLVSLAPRSEDAARRERRNKEEHNRGTDLRAAMSRIFLPLALCLFLLSLLFLQHSSTTLALAKCACSSGCSAGGAGVARPANETRIFEKALPHFVRLNLAQGAKGTSPLALVASLLPSPER